MEIATGQQFYYVRVGFRGLGFRGLENVFLAVFCLAVRTLTFWFSYFLY